MSTTFLHRPLQLHSRRSNRLPLCAGCLLLLLLILASRVLWPDGIQSLVSFSREWRPGMPAESHFLHAAMDAARHRGTCTEQIRQGRFDGQEAWTIGATPIPARRETRRGLRPNHVMRLGPAPAGPAAGGPGFSSISQGLAIPGDATASTLRWSWQRLTAEPPSSQPSSDGDRQQVLLLDASGRLLEVVASTRIHSPQWAFETYDLTPYAGQTIRVYFNTYNDGNAAATSMYLDNISVLSCRPPGTGTPGSGQGPQASPVQRADPPRHALAGFLFWIAALAGGGLLAALGFVDLMRSGSS